ncbi:predicted GPI-anchored protein 58 [Austrofundulus limnaeus]|uniref:Predicted GPI-anchored protein 58 n=1 Tax=Austrofundulus limnaeus TaxID=52670 RepID=A0A2I4CBM1_AUSLI|nr:PREDICTED: predicted GPI-anchored protein 58 [Austrofundulus limnaeus]
MFISEGLLLPPGCEITDLMMGVVPLTELETASSDHDRVDTFTSCEEDHEGREVVVVATLAAVTVFTLADLVEMLSISAAAPESLESDPAPEHSEPESSELERVPESTKSQGLIAKSPGLPEALKISKLVSAPERTLVPDAAEDSLPPAAAESPVPDPAESPVPALPKSPKPAPAEFLSLPAPLVFPVTRSTGPS